MEEMQVNVETAHLENQKLRAEVAEMTGDDMRAAPPPQALGASNNTATATATPSSTSAGVKESDRSNSPPPAPAAAKNRRASTDAANTSSRSAAAAAKALNLPARRAEIEVSIEALKELVHLSLGTACLAPVTVTTVALLLTPSFWSVCLSVSPCLSIIFCFLLLCPRPVA